MLDYSHNKSGCALLFLSVHCHMPQKHLNFKIQPLGCNGHFTTDILQIMATTVDKRRVLERDLTPHLRGLVDGCFEEGQYDAGLAALDQLRSSTYRPAP